MELMTAQTPMREIEIFGIPALFTDQEIDPEEIGPAMHCYVLVSAEDGETLLGTVLTPVPVELPETGERDVYDDDLMLDTEGDMLTPEEFEEKYLSPDYGGEDGEGDANGESD